MNVWIFYLSPCVQYSSETLLLLPADDDFAATGSAANVARLVTFTVEITAWVWVFMSNHRHFICPIIQQYAHLHEHNSRRAGQQGLIWTLTAALKRSVKTVTGCIFYHTNKNITKILCLSGNNYWMLLTLVMWNGYLTFLHYLHHWSSSAAFPR